MWTQTTRPCITSNKWRALATLNLNAQCTAGCLYLPRQPAAHSATGAGRGEFQRCDQAPRRPASTAQLGKQPCKNCTRGVHPWSPRAARECELGPAGSHFRPEKEWAANFCMLVSLSLQRGRGSLRRSVHGRPLFAGPPRGAAGWADSSDSPQTWAHVRLAGRSNRRPAAPSTPLLR